MIPVQQLCAYITSFWCGFLHAIQYIQWGWWDYKSKEMIFSIVCHLEFSQAQLRGDFLANYITRLFGRRLSLRTTRLAAVFIRTGYTISRGSITLLEFSRRKGERIPCFCL